MKPGQDVREGRIDSSAKAERRPCQESGLSNQRASLPADVGGRACGDASRLCLIVEGDRGGAINTKDTLIKAGGPLPGDERAAASLAEIAEWRAGWRGIRELGTRGWCEVSKGEQKQA